MSSSFFYLNFLYNTCIYSIYIFIMCLKKLNHLQKQTNEWIYVYALDTGACIDAEAEAMLQALHSRSTWWIKSHLKILEKKWADQFMWKFYVWYWHKSIWDCGSITLFIEWISMLGAKSIQDSKLYNWQEASTRYIDFSKQKILNPAHSKLWLEIQEQQRKFYLSILQPIKDHLKNKFPKNKEEKDLVYEKAISAKAFDIARWFLPAGTTTNLAWHSNLRQVADRILQLRHHPLTEIQSTASTILDVVSEKYPNSFSHKKYQDTEDYLDLVKKDYYFYDENIEKLTLVQDAIDQEEFKRYEKLFSLRPNEKTELPGILNNIWTLKFRFLLDFGSFRDIQRHRAIYQQMPLLTDKQWFNEFYIQSLPFELQESAVKHLNSIKEKTDILNLPKEERQYYIPMWYNISNEIMGTLPSLIYMIELRSTRFVHPTLRKIAHWMWKILNDKYNIKLFLDNSEIDFDSKRWEQDISIK